MDGMKRTQEIVATVERQLFKFGDDESATVVIAGRNHEGEPFSLKGPTDGDHPLPFVTYRFYGNWSEYRGQPQFAYNALVKHAAVGRGGVCRYLKAKTKLTPSMLNKLYAEYGDKAIEKLREDPKAVAATVAKLTEAAANEASKVLKESHVLELATISLMDLLGGYYLPKSIYSKILAKLGGDAASIIKKNPYILMQFPGCGFKRADAIYLDLGLPPNDIIRQTVCLMHATATIDSGSTWKYFDQVRHVLSKSISGDDLRAVEARQRAVDEELVVLERTDGLNGPIDWDGSHLWIASAGNAKEERSVAQAVFLSQKVAKNHSGWPVDGLRKMDILAESQLDALEKALKSPFSLLVGGPGTGKTTIATAYLKELLRHYSKENIAITATTGKASMRCTESLRANGVELTATTIHSLLKVESVSDLGWRFHYNKSNPLPHQVIIVDEASMCDTSVMAHLLNAKADDAKIMFIGDVNQLPPVGHGAPLRDLMQVLASCGELTEIHRNSGQIVVACNDIRQGRKFAVGGNLRHVGAVSAAEQMRKILETINQSVREFACDPIWDVQVIVPINSKSEISKNKVNGFLQEALNLNPAIRGSKFRVGDKVVNSRNGYMPSRLSSQWRKDNRVYVANGEMGEVLEVHPKHMTVRLREPLREVIAITGGDSGDEDEEDSRSACSWDLGYAISCHKSQGSEWPVAIVAIDGEHAASRICTREWIYTAISRAKKCCYLVGDLSVAQRFVQKTSIHERKTLLKEMVNAFE